MKSTWPTRSDTLIFRYIWLSLKMQFLSFTLIVIHLVSDKSCCFNSIKTQDVLKFVEKAYIMR